MNKIKMKVKRLSPDAITPTKALYGSENQLGIDFYAIEKVKIPAGGRAAVKTGIAIELEAGYGLILKDKSGIASKRGFSVMAGVIDCDYRGEILAILHNTGSDSQNINKGDACIQGIIMPIFDVEIELADNLSDTSRGDKGFGSSTKQDGVNTSAAIAEKMNEKTQEAKQEAPAVETAVVPPIEEVKQAVAEVAEAILDNADAANIHDVEETKTPPTVEQHKATNAEAKPFNKFAPKKK